MSLNFHINQISKILEKEEKEEEKVKRYAFFPILDEKAFEFYEKQEIIHWAASELDFQSDCKWYDKLNSNSKKVIDTILAFFLSGDGVICKNIVFRFLLECKTMEESAMFISQLHIEMVHAETYGLAAFTFKKDSQSMSELIESIEKTECISRKIDFMEKWMLNDSQRYERLLAYACAEGIFFCTLFAVVFWFRSKGQFPNFVTANEMISRDESLHRDWGAFLYLREIQNLPNKDFIKQRSLEIIQQAVEIEESFADYMLEESIEDLNKNDLKIYARLIADSLLNQIGLESYYNVKNPFTWLEDISMEQKTNFYELRVAAYKKKSLADVLNWRKRSGIETDSKNAYNDPGDVDF
jgi:ribonucleotide reductase beta subunit family protein with ferritin-like domain